MCIKLVFLQFFVSLSCELLPCQCPGSWETPGGVVPSNVLGTWSLCLGLTLPFGQEPFAWHGWYNSRPSEHEPTFKAGAPVQSPAPHGCQYPSPSCWVWLQSLLLEGGRTLVLPASCCRFSPGPSFKDTTLLQVYKKLFVLECSYVFTTYFLSFLPVWNQKGKISVPICHFKTKVTWNRNSCWTGSWIKPEVNKPVEIQDVPSGFYVWISSWR